MKNPFLRILTITTEGEHLQVYETKTEFNDEAPRKEQAINWLVRAIEATGRGTGQGVKAHLEIETAFRSIKIDYNSRSNLSDQDRKSLEADKDALWLHYEKLLSDIKKVKGERKLAAIDVAHECLNKIEKINKTLENG